MAGKRNRTRTISLDMTFVVKFRVPDGANLDDLDDMANSISMLAPPQYEMVEAVLGEWNVVSKVPARQK